MSQLNNCPEESQMHLESMLYLLNDPALDRSAFESRLEHDPKLAEILANTVDSYQALLCVPSWQASATSQFVSPVASKTIHYYRSWQMLGALAASILIVALTAWQLLFSIRQQESVLSANEPELQNNIVLAWSDMQSNDGEPMLFREIAIHEIENESSLAVSDFSGELEIPDWIVLAASDSISGSLEPTDGKGVTQ